MVAAFLALNIFDKTSGIVWAEVVKRLEDIKTGIYKITTDAKGMVGISTGIPALAQSNKC